MPDSTSATCSEKLHHAINLRLALLGCPTVSDSAGAEYTDMASPIFARYRETTRQLIDPLPPVDHRIQAWLEHYLTDVGPAPMLPAKTLILDQAGMARLLSLPAKGDEFSSSLLKSYRLRQGVLHNPASDRRTTQGVFHVAEGGLPVPDDKLAVPKQTFSKMLEIALRPPRELLRLPYTGGEKEPAETFVSLYLRPLVCPSVPGFIDEKRMETRFIVPGSLVSNLDFIESIFGNAGDPYLPENDAGLDVDHWTGHTGCVILAPHLVSVPKHLAGLPHWDLATPRQRRDGMCWKDESELYNGGSAFKLTARNEYGVMVTLIADNYYGYCKKEVKTQISFSANLYGLAEEEHAGGAQVFPSYDLGEEFSGFTDDKYGYEEALAKLSDRFDAKPEGYAVDKLRADVLLVPEKSSFNLRKQTVSWTDAAGRTSSIKLLAGKTYVRPSGYRVHMEPIEGARSAWRLVGTVPEGSLCHKPCTVSGGGKSEISKAISYAILPGHVFVADFDKDFDLVEEILKRDFSNRFRDATRNGKDFRLILSPQRTLGSVIKLLTPSRREYTDEHNDWLRGIPQHIKELVFVLKRFHRPEWGAHWRDHFSVDAINGRPGYELKLDGRKLVINCLRVGFEADGSWRVFGLRADFHPAAKVQMEDDITASVVAPTDNLLGGLAEGAATGGAIKIVQNCEKRLFQRPDDAIHRGYDHQAEADMASAGTFLSNYEPLNQDDAKALIEDAIGYNAYTEPMRTLIRDSANLPSPKYFVSSAHPRIVDGKPTKNPRYLQLRPDIADPLGAHLADLTARLHRKVGSKDPVYAPVTVLVPGRRNNPPEKGVRPLAMFNPIHFLELPELFMEYISSMTGKSPSTTGAGSEGALTKGPFNALPPIIDLNAALISQILTGHDAFVSAAGYVGPKFRVDHDVSLLIPEVFSRMTPEERSAKNLIAEGCLERCTDMEFNGKPVLSSRLGYRITTRFVRVYFGRVFDHPHAVFSDEMLRPEQQDLAVFADGMDTMVVTHKRVAESYFADKGIELAIPPLKALLHIMAEGHYEGKGLDHADIRALFDRETMLKSAWYQARLEAKRKVDTQLWTKHVNYLSAYLDRPNTADTVTKLNLKGRLAQAEGKLKQIKGAEYLASLRNTLGVQAL
jgi:phosphoenolpyruvate carboxykinase (diphosphate)